MTSNEDCSRGIKERHRTACGFGFPFRVAVNLLFPANKFPSHAISLPRPHAGRSKYREHVPRIPIRHMRENRICLLLGHRDRARPLFAESDLRRLLYQLEFLGMREHPPQSPQSRISVSRTARKQQSVAVAVFDSIQLLIRKPRSRKQVPAMAVVLPALFLERLRMVHPIDKLYGKLFESDHWLVNFSNTGQIQPVAFTKRVSSIQRYIQ